MCLRRFQIPEGEWQPSGLLGEDFYFTLLSVSANNSSRLFRMLAVRTTQAAYANYLCSICLGVGGGEVKVWNGLRPSQPTYADDLQRLAKSEAKAAVGVG